MEVSWGVLKALKVKLEWQEVIWWRCYCGSWCSITILDSSKQIWCMDTRIPRPISLPRNLLFTRSVLMFFWLKLGVRPQGSSQLHLWCSTKATVDPPEERKRSGPRSIRKVSTQTCRKICPKTTMSRARLMWLFQDMKKGSPNHGI